eukprot:SAG31_NODE_849_length_11529_cov_3.342257_8_plen_179_part_00
MLNLVSQSYSPRTKFSTRIHGSYRPAARNLKALLLLLLQPPMPAAPLLPLLALAAAGGTSFQTRPKAAGARPHIVFVLSDDLGYGDYATAIEMKPDATRIPTPNVARMAKNGLKFSRGYSGQVCAPSRTMLMLGKHLGALPAKHEANLLQLEQSPGWSGHGANFRNFRNLPRPRRPAI